MIITLPKSLFISVVESLRQQMVKDKNTSLVIGQVFNCNGVGLYDNSLLIKSLIELLHIYFPKDENGFSEIEHYCFDLNFGSIGIEEVLSIEDLWFQLTKSDE